MISNRFKLRDTEPEPVQLPVVLTYAGSDSSGGAGVEADLKTFSAFGVYGITCITALTAQNTTGVRQIAKTPQKMVSEILQANLEDFYGYKDAPLKAIKTGMLTEEAIYELAKLDLDVKMVVDPVMVSTSGSTLFDVEGVGICVKKLMSKAFLVTPNFEEAKTLFKLKGEDFQVTNLKEFTNFTIALQQVLKCKNLLVKGGHIPFDENNNVSASGTKIIDLLYEGESETITVFESTYIPSENSHGTGCTLSSAIAANLAKEKPLVDSVAVSIDFIHKGMRRMSKLGHGNGPLNHLVKPAASIEDVIESVPQIVHFSDNHTILDFMKQHADVKGNWSRYTEHPFVRSVAHNELPFDKFIYYLTQDYHYLIIYARIHALAASKAPTYQQAHAQATIIGEIVMEIEKHKEKMKVYDVDYDRDIDKLTPGKACRAYCDYLMDIGSKEDFLGIKVALAPCLHGYAEAGAHGQKLRLSNSRDFEHSDIYQQWLDDYTSDWYSNADKEGRSALHALTAEGVDAKRLESLVKIFNDVTQLEIDFWNEVLDL
ncbi:uncharacterized protein LODBEIA_P46560 [Lodderomyces beijingensis]|uniref:Phosphomethylpyrimidine kinase THI20 n=1 Tax=Lodderomyces beijingensis TaxID=1775926 RepID=A0ABP0ZSW2_9ASCO